MAEKKATRKEERELMAQIAEAQKAYHDAVQTLPHKDTIPFDEKVKSLKQKLSDMLSAGADPCPNEPKRIDDPKKSPEENEGIWNTMRHIVIGMKKVDDKIKGIEVYEVGCMMCQPRLIKVGDKLPKGGTSTVRGRLSMSSRAGSREAAVENWNDGEYIIDGNELV